jgi:BirA family transcriptional regulator, biotin operon repressor / biotin---[acetyl-CoA-carboxylase] ligase
MLAMAARREAHEGDWLIAKCQTAGIGREGRRWVSPFGNFYGSTLIRLNAEDHMSSSLALVAGIAVASAIGVPSILKWPNDLMIDGAKLAGILLERHGDDVVVGIGINVVSAPTVPGRSVTCLADHGMMFDEIRVFDAVHETLAAWRSVPLSEIIDRWLAHAHSIHTPLRANGIEGRFAGLNESGALRLALPDGAIHVIHTGDVFLI